MVKLAAELEGKKEKALLAAACPLLVKGDTGYQTQGSCKVKMAAAVVGAEGKLLLTKLGSTAAVGMQTAAVVAELAEGRLGEEMGRPIAVVAEHRLCCGRRGKLKELPGECDLRPSHAGALEMAVFSERRNMQLYQASWW